MTSGDLVVTLSSGATITIPVEQLEAPTAMPVTVTRGDDAYVESTTGGDGEHQLDHRRRQLKADGDDQHGHGQCDRRRTTPRW